MLCRWGDREGEKKAGNETESERGGSKYQGQGGREKEIER